MNFNLFKICLCFNILLNIYNVLGYNRYNDLNFIGSKEDIDTLINCSYLNGSLFINGDYNLNSLEGLEKLEEIDGFLVIIDSHMLKNYKGLHNLKRINGNNLYLKDYSAVSKYNNNFKNDSYRGLCYTDLIDWAKITDYRSIDLNNGLNCPQECHSECIGCFGPGPKLCQECKHFEYNDTCVSDCYFGNKSYCNDEFPIKKIDLHFKRINNTFINLFWNKLTLNESRGIIKEYKLIINDIEILKSVKSDNDYDYKNLINNYSYNIEFNKTYNFTICYSNNIGELCSNYYNYVFYDLTPKNVNYLELSKLSYNWLDVNYKYNFSNLVSYIYNNSLNYHYDNLTFYYSLNDNNFIEINNYSLFRVKDLYYNTKYNLTIKVLDSSINLFSNNSYYIYFKTLYNVKTQPSLITTTIAVFTKNISIIKNKTTLFIHNNTNDTKKIMDNNTDIIIKKEYLKVNNVTCDSNSSTEGYLITLLVFLILYIPVSIIMMGYLIRNNVNRNELTVLLDRFINRDTRQFSNPIYDTKVLKKEPRYLDIKPVENNDIDYYTSSDEDDIKPCKINNLVG